MNADSAGGFQMSAAPLRLSPRPRWHPWIGGLLLGAHLLTCALAGYWWLFRHFSWYDDESTFLLWSRELLEGASLYTDVPTFHGPILFLYHQLLFAGFGLPADHEVLRFATLTPWLLACLLLGLMVWRISGRVLPALICQFLVFPWTASLSNEPGHPQALTLMLVAAVLYVATDAAARREGRAWRLAGAGALLSLLVFTKLNAGAYLCLGLGLAVGLGLPLRSGRALRGALVVAALTVPAWLLSSDILHPVWSGLALAYATAIITVSFITALEVRGGFAEFREVAATALGGLVGGVLIVLAAGVLGATPTALLHSVFVLPADIPRTLEVLGDLQPSAVPLLATVVSLLLALVVSRVPRDSRQGVHGMLQCIFGAGVCLAAAARNFGSLAGAEIVGASVPFLWILVVGCDREDPREEVLAPRLALALAAASFGFYAYPIAGSQLALARILVIPCGCIGLADGLRNLHGVVPAFVSSKLRGAVATVVVVAIAVGQASQLSFAQSGYAGHVPLDLPGTAHLRLDERRVALYQFITANVKRHCDTYLGSPGIAGPYFWSGVPAPSELLSGWWIWTYDAEQQRRLGRDLDRFSKPCVLRNREGTAFLLRARRTPPKQLPLWSQLEAEYVTVAVVPEIVGFWEFAVRKGRQLDGLSYAAIPVATSSDSRVRELDLTLPPLPEGRIGRLTLVDLDRERVLADTRGEGAPKLQITALPSSPGEAAIAPEGIDASNETQLRLRWVGALTDAPSGFRVVRVHATDGTLLAPIPVVSGFGGSRALR